LPTTEPTRRRRVFIDCPFDDAYRPLLRAACFALLACGYRPRCALDDSDSGRLRFPAILDMLSGCDLSIHDISRVEIDAVSNLPRFNMALELGADLALRLRGPKFHRTRRTLVLDAEAHRYDQTLSDISGMDIAIHHNQPDAMIRQVRDWLNTGHVAERPLPGGEALIADHGTFLRLAPAIISNLCLESSDALTHGDYLYVVEEALAEMSRLRSAGTPAT
jgi:hypothetical protein